MKVILVILVIFGARCLRMPAPFAMIFPRLAPKIESLPVWVLFHLLQLLDHLSIAEPCSKWPVKLVNPILRGGGDEEEDAYAVPKLAGVGADGHAGGDDEPAYVNTTTVAPSEPEPEPEPAKAPGKLNVDQFKPASASLRADKTSKPITAPQISGPSSEAAEPKKAPVKRMSRAEKQQMMEEEERVRSERITSALRSMGTVVVDPTYDPKETMMDPVFLKARQDAKKAKEEHESEQKEQQQQNTAGWRSQAAAKKAARTAQAQPPPKVKPALKVKQRLERERREAEEAATKTAQAAKEKKEAEKAQLEKERKSKEQAEKLRAEREKMQADMLVGLPAWKRDKILRDQQKEREHLATVASEKVCWAAAEVEVEAKEHQSESAPIFF